MRDGDVCRQSTRTVLLEHTTPDGAIHLDWLIERPCCDADHRLIAFRCEHDPTTCSPWFGLRIADHRARYLDYEGPISNNRGRVRRLWSKLCVVREDSGSRIRLCIGCKPGTLLLGERLSRSDDQWVFRAE